MTNESDDIFSFKIVQFGCVGANDTKRLFLRLLCLHVADTHTTMAPFRFSTRPAQTAGVAGQFQRLVCNSWCVSMENDWTQKCTWLGSCGGCPQCSGKCLFCVVRRPIVYLLFAIYFGVQVTNSKTLDCPNSLNCRVADGVIGDGTPVDGGWSGFGACSKACGGGRQARTCSNPAPANGGKYCVGDVVNACNTQECGGKTF